MPRSREVVFKPGVSAVDLFCGAGGLTHGLLQAGIKVNAGYDIEEECRFPYEQNNSPSRFYCQDVAHATGRQLGKQYPHGHIKILAGCAPCQTFSKYTQGLDNKNDPKWYLLRHFSRLIEELKPDIVSMENVPDLCRHDIFEEFMSTLVRNNYFLQDDAAKIIIYCPDYGVPQMRRRLVVLASKLGPISIIPKTHQPRHHKTVRSTIGNLPKIAAGETHPSDPLHRASALSKLNMKRIRHSAPGGSWRDWPEELRADCHTASTGHTYSSVYGRMEWDSPSPTITTQFYGYGSGRFGHPDQARALSLREGAILQSFPPHYAFAPTAQLASTKSIGKMIGNAVPVRIGKIVGISIRKHLEQYGH